MRKTFKMSIGLFMAFALMIQVFPFMGVNVLAEAENLAAGKTVKVSRATAGKDHTKVVDGAKWASASGSCWNLQTGDWLEIDLGEPQFFNKVTIYEHSKQRCSGYLLETSTDGSTWNKISESSDSELIATKEGEMTGSSGNVPNFYNDIVFSSVEARYLRLTIKKVVSTASTAIGYISEIEVYDDPNATVPGEPGKPTPPPTNPDKPTTDKPGNHTFSDVTEGADAVNVLNGLNVIKGYDDGTFKPENNVTRGEFSAIIARALKLDGVFAANAGKNIFTDVPATNQFAGYINALYDMGVINGTSGTEFKPDDPILYEQAVKIIVNMLGYKPKAEIAGGYPYGYIATAEEIGITKALKQKTMGENAKRITVAQMLYNALDIDYMELAYIGDKPSYEIKKGKTLLSTIFKATKKTGKMIATSDSIHANSSMLSDNEVKIDENIYRTGNTNAFDYLGYSVTFIYAEDSLTGENTLLTVGEAGQRNQSLQIDSRDIENADFSEISYNLEDNSKVLKARLEQDAPIYYNGKAASGYTEEILWPAAGYLKLVDSNADGKYDSIFVNEYVNIVVDTVDAKESRVVSKYLNAPSLTLDPDDTAYTVYIKKDGKPIKVSDLKEWDILTVKADKMIDSANGKTIDTEKSTLYYVEVSGKSIQGEVEQLIDGEEKVVIGGKTYEYAKSIQNDANLIPKMGDKATFYLDVFGRIAAANLQETTGITTVFMYGINGEYDSFANNIELKVYTLEDKHVIYPLAEKIRVNDRKSEYISMELLKNSGLVDENMGVKRQLISIKLSSDGKITNLYTAVSPQDNADRKAVLEASFGRVTSGSQRLYHSYIKKFRTSGTNPEFSTDSKAKVFVVPSDRTVTDESRFAVKTMSYFVNGYRYDVQGYNANDIGVVPLVVCYAAGPKVDSRDYLLLVSKVTTAINDKGEIVKKVDGIFNGNEVSYYTSTDDTIMTKFDGIKPGDLIEIELNRYKEICDMQRHLDYTAPPKSEPEATGLYTQIMCGELIDKDGDYIKLRLETSSGVEERTFFVGGSKVYKYNISKQKTSNSSLDALVPGSQKSWIALRYYYNRPREIVIYEN